MNTASFFALFLALFVCVVHAQVDDTYLGRGTLRNDKLNYAISNTLQNLYFDHVNAQDDIAVKYGNFGPLSFSSGAAGVINPNMVGALTGELIALFSEIGTDDVTYTDVGFPGQEFYAQTPQQIGAILGSVVVAGKVYGQYHVIGHATVEQIGDDLYRVGGSCDALGRIAPLPGDLYPVNDAQLLQYTIRGHRYHIYQRQIDGDEVSFKLKAVQGYGRMSEALKAAPLRYNDTPFADIQ